MIVRRRHRLPDFDRSGLYRQCIRKRVQPAGDPIFYGTYHENGGRHPADKNGVWPITEKLAAETAPVKVIRVGSFEDTFKGSFARTFVRAKAPFLCAFCKKAHPLPQRNRTRVIFVNKYVKID